ncbi:hypothetical protein A1Q1_05662 [Trichosporon asahii var. asahii CBS 2479]|uniref:Zn(2)-C6 fungal-type domain-containing protein n=1 Tax=Trichosporon asahii var. asahii (strain ATCC 90039 / CBS 2479 / JCM 2466 / KCTC 7840 / NBRC 103889/ NCYC 2677 / UAMH 7654) TaxID=1186058 RepID=J5SIW7_TRIAS|nr:hypothetical protein A1Q1_05662 [Trichosporon asahii var. asahii CBS 2479]EJT45856.1 hypothetical protein A1Q1_05662 [Trichosporon asahii var. asahii CBS 2479]
MGPNIPASHSADGPAIAPLPPSSLHPPQRPPPPQRNASSSSLTLNKGTSKEVQRQKSTFISCTHCRARKVKCSGDKPLCTNCLKRGLNCHYDAFVKRRGPDKEPGGESYEGDTGGRRAMWCRNGGREWAWAVYCRVYADAAGRLRARGTFVNYAAPRSGSNGAVHVNRVPSAPHAPGVVGMGLGGQQGPVRFARIVSAGPPLSHLRHPAGPGLGIGLGRPSESKNHSVADPPHSTPHAPQAHAQMQTQQDAIQAAHRDGWALLLKDYTLPQLTQICHLFVLLAAFEFQPHVHQNLSRAIAAWSFVESCATSCIPESQEPPEGGAKGTTAAIEAAEMRRLDWTFSQLSASLTIWDCLLDKAHGQSLPSLSRMVNYARSLLREAQATQDSGTRNYAWQATDWTKVALGMLGDLDDSDVARWMADQKKALMNVSNPTDLQERQQLQSFCWWYLMVAYTHSAESVLAEVDKALNIISGQWSCSGEFCAPKLN